MRRRSINIPSARFAERDLCIIAFRGDPCGVRKAFTDKERIVIIPMRDTWSIAEKRIVMEEIQKIKLEFDRVRALYDALISLMMSMG